MKVFLAGGTGVLGRRALPRLVAAGHDVSVVVRSPAKAEAVAAMGGRPVRVSLFDPDSLRVAVVGHDAVINLATHIPPVTAAARRSAWAENDRIRTEGVANLVAAARSAGVGRFVQESVAFACADGGDRELDEDAPVPDPPPFNTASVAAAEERVAAFTEAGGTGVVLRFGLFHAPESGHTAACLVPTRWGRVPLPGAPGAYLPIVHADDAADAVVSALAAPAGVFNVTADETPTRAGYARALDDALGDPGRVRPLPERVGRLMARSAPSLAWSQRASNRRFRTATAWRPAHPTAAAVLRSVVAAGREARRLRSGWAAVGLVVLALGSLFVGAWALASPLSFHASFPGFGHVWVAPDGPFNEHLIRDVGAFELALALVALAAVASMTLALVRTAALAHLVAGVPHLAYHATHLHPFAGADQVAIVVSLAVPVAVAAALLAVSSRRPGAGPRATGAAEGPLARPVSV
jgi:nucleoside-diphosphate-sugar epimerase